MKRLLVFSVIIRHKRNDCSISVSTILLDDSIVDASVHAEYKNHPQETEHSPCLLEVDPVEHQFIVFIVSLLKGICTELGFLIGDHEPADIN